MPRLWQARRAGDDASVAGRGVWAVLGLGALVAALWAPFPTGQAWWQGDEGPYWGHNAVIRIAPFRAHARLETLPDGSHILSHDQVEAILLHELAHIRRSDYLVNLLQTF